MKLPRLGAALACYKLFSATPPFVIGLAIAGFCFRPEAARWKLFVQISALVGHDGSEAPQDVVAAANKPWLRFEVSALP